MLSWYIQDTQTFTKPTFLWKSRTFGSDYTERLPRFERGVSAQIVNQPLENFLISAIVLAQIRLKHICE